MNSFVVYLVYLPLLEVEAAIPAVQVVRLFAGCVAREVVVKLISFAVYDILGISDSVGDPADRAPKVSILFLRLGFVLLHAVKTEDDVYRSSLCAFSRLDMEVGKSSSERTHDHTVALPITDHDPMLTCLLVVKVNRFELLP